jgi:phage minor structural protein
MSTQLFVLDEHTEEVVAVLSTDGTACPYYDSEFTRQVNGNMTLKFTVPRNHPDAAKLEDGAIILFHLDGDPADWYHEYRITETEVTHDDDLLMDVFCEHGRIELMDNVVTDRRPTDASARDALAAILAGSRYQVGIVDDLGVNSTVFYYINSLAAITQLISVWGGEVRYRTTVSGNKITGRYVDILQRLGSDTGKRFEYKYDTEKVTRHIDRTGVKTALYARGKGISQSGSDDTYGPRLTFADVEWSVANGDPVDKPLGQEWVGHPEALTTHGYPDGNGGYIHKFGVVFDDDETDPLRLLWNTWDLLQVVSDPIVQYDCDVIDIYSITGGVRTWERVDLGDTTVVLDDDLGAEIESRVIEITQDLSDLTNAKVKLGNFLPSTVDSGGGGGSGVEQRLSTLESIINNKGPAWDNKSVGDTDLPDIMPDQPQNFTAMPAFSSVVLAWDVVPSLTIANYELYASQTSGFIPSTENLIYKGKTGWFKHDVDVNQTWYYRLRAVNTHGTVGPFTDEAWAMTERINTVDIQEGAIQTQLISDLAVSADKVAAAAIETDKLADMAVVTAKIAEGAVVASTLADGAVIEEKIADAAITAQKIVDGTIGDTKLMDLAVTASKIANGAVTADKIADGAITDSHLDAGSISEAKMNWNTHLIF